VKKDALVVMCGAAPVLAAKGKNKKEKGKISSKGKVKFPILKFARDVNFRMGNPDFSFPD
jgi:hypothetical protein